MDGWMKDTNWMSNTGWLVCDNYTETAQWTANTYTVSYDGNGEDSGCDMMVQQRTTRITALLTMDIQKKVMPLLDGVKIKHAARARYSPGEMITWSNRADKLTLCCLVQELL